jgi:hypothetical protein
MSVGERRIAMRKYLAVSVLTALLLVLGSGSAAVAGSGGSTYYAGKNAQGQKLLFSVDHTANGPRFDPFFTTMIDRCPITGDVIEVEFSFEGIQFPIKNGKFNVVLNDISDRFNWSGSVTSKKASGTESFGLAAFGKKGGLQDCATGPISWKADALVPAAVRTARPRAGYLVKITRAPNGSVHFSITHR